VPDATDHAGVYVPPPLIYLTGFVVGWGLHYFWPRQFLPSRLAPIVGATCISLALLLVVWSLTLFARAKTAIAPTHPATSIVSRGPYRVSRNPIYIGMAFLYTGIAAWMNALGPLLMLPIVLLVIHTYVISREERYLERKFGEEYRRYQGRVRRWL
jgi:protein-S-isoprenylcysteine O-methyltransferase Ste14